MKRWKKMKETKGEKEIVKTKKQIVMGKRKRYRKQTSKNWWRHSHLHPPQTSPLATSTQQLPRVLLWTLWCLIPCFIPALGLLPYI